MSYLHCTNGDLEQAYQSYLQLCRQSGRVLTGEEARASGLEPNDLAYYYGSFAKAMKEAEHDLRLQASEARVRKKPAAELWLPKFLLEERVRQQEEDEKWRMQRARRREKHLMRHGETRKTKGARGKEVEVKATRKEVMSYMRELLSKYPNPTQPDARSYSASVYAQIFPRTVKSVLGVDDWDEALAICREELGLLAGEVDSSANEEVNEMKSVDEVKDVADAATTEVPKRRGRPKGSKNKPKEGMMPKKRTGRPKKEQAASKEEAMPKKKLGRPKKVKTEEPMAEKVAKPADKRVAKPATSAATVELKILIPGMPEPIVMEFSVKK